MKFSFIPALSIILVFIFSTQSFANKNDMGIDFLDSPSFKTIQKIAKEQKKPIFLDFTAAWCIHCREMEKTVFRSPRVAELMNSAFINYKVNVDKGNGSMMSLIYGVEQLPTILFVTPEGEVIIKDSYKYNEEKFLEVAEEARQRFAAENPDAHIQQEPLAQTNGQQAEEQRHASMPAYYIEPVAREERH